MHSTMIKKSSNHDGAPIVWCYILMNKMNDKKRL